MLPVCFKCTGNVVNVFEYIALSGAFFSSMVSVIFMAEDNST